MQRPGKESIETGALGSFGIAYQKVRKGKGSTSILMNGAKTVRFNNWVGKEIHFLNGSKKFWSDGQDFFLCPKRES